MGMADMSKYVECSGCRHRMSEHKQIEFGPMVCTVEGCDCRKGPAQRDDLVDVILNMREFLTLVRNRLDKMNQKYYEEISVFNDYENISKEIHAFLCSLDRNMRELG